MKYIFETDEPITDCWSCPCGLFTHVDGKGNKRSEQVCELLETRYVFCQEGVRPADCPLREVTFGLLQDLLAENVMGEYK